MDKKDSSFLIKLAKRLEETNAAVNGLAMQIEAMKQSEKVNVVKENAPAANQPTLIVSSLWKKDPTHEQTATLHNQLNTLLSGYGILQANIKYVQENIVEVK